MKKTLNIKYNGQPKEVTLIFCGVRVFYKTGGSKVFKSLAIAKRFTDEESVREIKSIYTGYLYDDNNHPVKRFDKEYEL